MTGLMLGHQLCMYRQHDHLQLTALATYSPVTQDWIRKRPANCICVTHLWLLMLPNLPYQQLPILAQRQQLLSKHQQLHNAACVTSIATRPVTA